MAGNKTVETGASVRDFIDAVENEQKRRDSRELLTLMEAISGSRAAMWGSSMVGFGRYHYRYASGREGEFFLTGFSPRKTALTVYVMPGLDRYSSQLERLGPHKTGKSCLYLKSLDAVDRAVLEEIITDSVKYMRKTYDCK
jgi:hypothetical protein